MHDSLSFVYITLHLNVAFIPIALFITVDNLKKAKEIESTSYRALVITTFIAWCALSYSTISQAYNWLKEERFESSLIVEIISLALVAIVTAAFIYFRNKRYKEKILQE